MAGGKEVQKLQRPYCFSGDTTNPTANCETNFKICKFEDCMWRKSEDVEENDTINNDNGIK